MPISPARAREWLGAALAQKGGPSFSVSHTVTYYGGVNAVFSVISLVKDVDRNENVGVIKVDVLAEQIALLFANVETDSDSVFALLDQDNAPIYSSHPDFVPTGTRSPWPLEDLDGEYTVYSKEVGTAGWKLVYLSSNRALVGKLVSIYLITGLLGCLTLVSAAMLFHYQSRRMSQALADINAAMEQVAQGDLVVKTAAKSGVPEFDAIGESLGQMATQLEQYIEENYRALLSRRTAEYNALQAQVNPHFLYNTLNGFIALNRIGEKQLLEESIIMLTRMFRYTCSGGSSATIAEEFAFLEQYLSLQKMRYEDRVDYQIEMAPGTERILIPKLLFQPLVENCIIHGMKECRHPVMILITADFSTMGGLAEGVLVHISDNGMGFDVKAGRTRVGLENVRERLELFDNSSFFQIKSHPGLFTSCTIIFPNRGRKEVRISENTVG
jgi:two-component system sensor histidine kinase YesM